MSLVTGLKKNQLLKIVATYGLIVLLFLMFVKLFLEGAELSKVISVVGFQAFVDQWIVLLVFNIANGYVNYLILKHFEVNLKFSEWFGLGVVNTLSNYLLPFKMGTLVKATYLKNKYSFAISHSASILLFATYVSLQTLFVVSSVAFSYVKFFEPNLLAPVSFGFLGFGLIDFLCTFSVLGMVIGFSCFAIALKLKIKTQIKSKMMARVLNILALLQDGVKSLSTSKHLLVAIVVMALLSLVMQIMSFKFAYQAVGVDVNLFGLLCVNLLNTMGFFVSILPGNFVVQEVLISVSTKLLGVGLEEGFVVSGIIRLGAMSFVGSFGLFFYYYLRMSKVMRKVSSEVS